MAPHERPARSVVIPMYNEAQRIGGTLALIRDSPLDDEAYELILVDDGSLDGTADLAEKHAAELGLTNVRVIRSAINRGKGAAVRAGMLAAAAPYRVFADADLSAGIDDIVECFARLESGTADVVYASRAHEDSVIGDGQPGHRVMTGRVFNLVLRRLGLTQELDTQCGLKGFTAESADTLFTAVTIEGFAFDVEVLALAHREGMRVVPMPTRWSHADASRVRPIRDGVAMLNDVIALRRAIRRAGPAQTTSRSTDPASLSRYETRADLEREHWWFRAKRALVAQSIALHHQGGGVGLDVGCGSGVSIEALDGHTDVAFGVDLDGLPAALVASRGRHGHGVVLGAPTAVPARGGSVDVLTSLDVLQRLDDDGAALAEYRRLLSPHGTLVVTAPAYQWAWGAHDELMGHRRRYTADQLRDVAESAGFEVVTLSYFHSWLAPIAAVVRRTPARYLLRGEEEEVSYFRPSVNRALYALASIERRRLRRGAVGVGLSVLLVARPD